MTSTFSITTVKELMTPHPTLISPNATLEEAAQKMKNVDCGALPVGTENKLKGIITDRDIVIRALAGGKNPATEKVMDYMTKTVFACNENDTLEDAAEKMRQHKVSRLVVRNKEGRVTGILSFGGILRNDASAREVAGVVKHACGPAV
jgi:CBS domain-containing protein